MYRILIVFHLVCFEINLFIDLQKSSSTIGKVPVIILSISYQGVKFIDAKSKVPANHIFLNFCL